MLSSFLVLRYPMWKRLLSLGLVLCFLGEVELRAITPGNEASPQATNLQPGDFVWQPQNAPNGPVVIIVDLSQQAMQVYRNGTLIGRSTIGAGKGEHPTPTGIFTILQKELTHHSTKYHEASMPYMQRLTWDGGPLHEESSSSAVGGG
jgi:hypothetical protein